MYFVKEVNLKLFVFSRSWNDCWVLKETLLCLGGRISPPDKEPIPILVLVLVTWHLFCVV